MIKFLPKTILCFFSLFFLAIIVGKFSPTLASSMLLNPPFSNVGEGKDLSIDVVIKGNEETVDGVDVVASYDVNFLKVKEIKNGSFFSNYPVKKSDNGKIRISALAPTSGVKIIGDIVIATIKFEILDSGQTSVTLSFQKDSTIDSNIPTHTTTVDSLTEVQSGSYSVIATAENVQLAKAKKAKKSLPLWPFFIILLLIIGGGVWYYLKKRKAPKENIFIPEEFPLDRPPKLD